MIKIYIRLREKDFSLLRDLAEREYRDPRQQAALLVREALELREYSECRNKKAFGNERDKLDPKIA
jgi:hypothetical protein